MLRIFFIFLFFITTLLHAEQFPRFFSKLGTPLYKADKAFSQLSSLEGLGEKSKAYHTQAQALLIFAREMEKTKKGQKEKRKAYVKGLRDLQKEHDELIRVVNAHLLKSIDADDYKTFSHIINSGIDAILENKVIYKRAMAYYVGHRTRGKIALLDTFFTTLESDTELMDYVRGHLPRVQWIEEFYSDDGETYKAALSRDGKRAFLANAGQCFKTIDISDFSAASEIASFEFPTGECELQDVSLSENADFIYLSDAKNGFALLDLSLPGSPVLISEYTRLRAISSLSFYDSIVFVARKQRGLSILNISDSQNPKLIANYNRGLSINNIALDISKKRLYLMHTKGMDILDISILGNPRKISSYELPGGSFHAVVPKGKDALFLAAGKEGVKVLDVSDENNISVLSTYLTPTDARHLLLSKDEQNLFISALEGGVSRVNTSDLHYLKHEITYKIKTEGEALSTTMGHDEKKLYISYGRAGLAKVNLTQPE